MAMGRGYAELAVVDAALAAAVPPAMGWAEAGALPVADLSEEAPAGRFQLSGPLLQPLQFAVLAGQQVRIRAHG